VSDLANRVVAETEPSNESSSQWRPYLREREYCIPDELRAELLIVRKQYPGESGVFRLAEQISCECSSCPPETLVLVVRAPRCTRSTRLASVFRRDHRLYPLRSLYKRHRYGGPLSLREFNKATAKARERVCLLLGRCISLKVSSERGPNQQ